VVSNETTKPSAMAEGAEAYTYGPNGIPLRYEHGTHFTYKGDKFL
jgi:hypothetical protein